MITEQEWRQACERVGLWLANQKCELSWVACGRFRYEPSDIGGSIFVHDHDVMPPPIGDPATVLAMLEWLSNQGDVELISTGDGQGPIEQMATVWSLELLTEEHPKVIDAYREWCISPAEAIVRAVLALPKGA